MKWFLASHKPPETAKSLIQGHFAIQDFLEWDLKSSLQIQPACRQTQTGPGKVCRLFK